MQVYALLATTTVCVAFGGVVGIVGVFWREMRRAAPRLSDSDIVGGGLGQSTTSGGSPAPGPASSIENPLHLLRDWRRSLSRRG